MATDQKISRKENILQCLAHMLESGPGERITTAALAREVGVSEAALYRHFPSKARMFEGLIEFIRAASDPFHAVAGIETLVREAGFTALDGAAAWQLQAGGRYYTTRNDSALIAFTLGEQELVMSGIRMAGAHTDSPCLRVKPQPELVRQGYLQLGVEVYGGALFNPWFDRDLSLSGRVNFINGNGELDSCLLNLQKPIAVIPSLAIHLDREANQSRSVNAQTDLPPVLLSLQKGESFSFNEFLLEQLRQLPEQRDARKVLSYELSFYDTQPPALVGLRDQFIASARLDNLLSCYVCLQSLLSASAGEKLNSNLVVFNDHEEVGSTSTSGADGPFLRSVLERLLAHSGSGDAGAEAFERMIRRSFFLSVDNAHGIHPNYSDRHDGNHGPLLNRGPVLKINSNQRYASNSNTSAVFANLCEQENVPLQKFVVPVVGVLSSVALLGDEDLCDVEAGGRAVVAVDHLVETGREAQLLGGSRLGRGADHAERAVIVAQREAVAVEARRGVEAVGYERGRHGRRRYTVARSAAPRRPRARCPAST